MAEKDPIRVEVAYALPDEQKIISLEVSQGTTAFEAAVQSAIARQFGGFSLDECDMGIFGKVVKSREYFLKEGDRVEIYRPLKADPKEVRKKRAAMAKAKKAD